MTVYSKIKAFRGDTITIPILAVITEGATVTAQCREDIDSYLYIPIDIVGSDMVITPDKSETMGEGTWYLELEQTIDGVVSTLQRTDIIIKNDVNRVYGLPVEGTGDDIDAEVNTLTAAQITFDNATGGDMTLDSLIVDDFTITDFLKQIKTGVDTGIEILEQFSVGSPGNGRESIFGEGHAYGVGLQNVGEEGTPEAGHAWHCNISDTVGNQILNATDITTIIAKSGVSSIGLFGGVSAGRYLLVGSDYTYGGAKVLMTQLGIVEPMNIQGEYLIDGVNWYPVKYMATNSKWPFEKTAWNISQTLDEQWRFELDPEFLPVPWVKSTISINGTNYTKYWARLRITSDITLDPTVDLIQLHTNRTKINEGGMIEMFGQARQPIFLRSGLYGLVSNTLATASSADVSYSPTVTAAYQNNRFANNADDGFIITQSIPEEVDTSINLQLSISFEVMTTAIGNIEFQAEVYQVTDGFIYDGTATPDTEISKIVTISDPSQYVRKTILLKIPINKIDRGGVLIYIHRDARSTNSNDTLEANIRLTHIDLKAYRWRA